MKSNRNPLFAGLLVLAASSLLFTACRKSPEEIVEILTESEAAEIVETTVAERNAGVTMPAVEMAELVDKYLSNCGIPGDTTLQKSKSGAVTTYSYTFNLDWLVNCNNLNIPVDATTSVAGNGSFAAPHWTGANTTAGTLVFTGLELQSPDYIANGSYTFQGDITGSLRRVSPTFNCVTEIVLHNLMLDKTDYSISGGTGTAVITGTTGNGQTKTLTGNLVFNGNGTATVTVNSYSHTFQL